MGGGSGLLNARALSSRLSSPGKKTDGTLGSGTLAVYSAFESVSSDWVDSQMQHLISVAKSVDAKADTVATLTYEQLVNAWGEDQAEQLGAVLEKAKQRRIAKYEGDMLFQGYDDAVVIEIKIK